MVYYGVDTTEIFKSIIKQYNYNEHKDDDSWYYDIKHEVIDEYCMKYDYQAKEIVNSYGVFKAIKLHQDQYGEFEINENESKNYLILFYVILDEQLMNDHQEELENYKGKENENKDDSDYDSDDSCMSEDGPRINRL